MPACAVWVNNFEVSVNKDLHTHQPAEYDQRPHLTRDNWQPFDPHGLKHTDLVKQVGVKCVLHLRSLYVDNQLSPKHRKA